MTDIIPTPGRVVIYTLNQEDVKQILKRRGMDWKGNDVNVGDEYPAIIIRTWGSTPTSAVNLKVLLDGVDDHWATSRSVGEGPGHYQWMAYQKGQAAKTEALEAKLAKPANG